MTKPTPPTGERAKAGQIASALSRGDKKKRESKETFGKITEAIATENASTLQQIADFLNEREHKAPQGGKWQTNQVRRVLNLYETSIDEIRRAFDVICDLAGWKQRLPPKGTRVRARPALEGLNFGYPDDHWFPATSVTAAGGNRARLTKAIGKRPIGTFALKRPNEKRPGVYELWFAGLTEADQDECLEVCASDFEVIVLPQQRHKWKTLPDRRIQLRKQISDLSSDERWSRSLRGLFRVGQTKSEQKEEDDDI